VLHAGVIEEIRGRPSGCTVRRSMLIGGSSSAGSAPSHSSEAAGLASIRFQSPSTISAGFGWWASSSRRNDSRSGCINAPS
jgi:hypothetical protein